MGDGRWEMKGEDSSMLGRRKLVRVVDNRVLVLGLDELYRSAMMRFEADQLLPCAEKVTGVLGLEEAVVPIEGYYTESAELTRYFRLMKAIKECPARNRPAVETMKEFRLLLSVTASPLFGHPEFGDGLLPSGRDPLARALIETSPKGWNVDTLVDAAHDAAIRDDDISLVGLGARITDAVVMTACRESVVLYALLALGASLEQPEYVYEWNVDQHLALAANRFVDTFNRFVPGALPSLSEENAESLYWASGCNAIRGRCVRIGFDESGRQYHWAISLSGAHDDFWDDHVWTTEEYQRAKGIQDIAGWLNEE